MESTLLFAVIWVFGWMILLIVIWQLRARAKEREIDRKHKERLKAMEHGIPLPELPPERERGSLAAEMWAQLHLNPRWPLGIGALCVMLGIGICLALWFSGEEYQHQHASFGLIGIFLGAGLWLHYFLTRP